MTVIAREEHSAEWLEANGLGGFASGTVGDIRTRRYHSLLMTENEFGRFVLVNGFDAWVASDDGTFPISSQLYDPDIVHPGGAFYLTSFQSEPWPRWQYEFPSGIKLEQELFVPHESEMVVLSWRLLEPRKDVALIMRPLISGRDYHSLMRENEVFQLNSELDGERTVWRPHESLPAICIDSNGTFEHDAVWYRNFLYTEERRRGLDHVEDLASPGVFRWTLGDKSAVWIASACADGDRRGDDRKSAHETCTTLRDAERIRRTNFACPLERAADA